MKLHGAQFLLHGFGKLVLLVLPPPPVNYMGKISKNCTYLSRWLGVRIASSTGMSLYNVLLTTGVITGEYEATTVHLLVLTVLVLDEQFHPT